MQGGAFGIGVPGTTAALPPLRHPGHRRVVQRHFRIQPPDPPAKGAHPETHLRLFSGNQILAIALYGIQCGAPHQRVAPAGLRLAHGAVPFGVDHAIPKACLGVAFAAASADHGQLGRGIQRGAGGVEPSGIKGAVAIDELDVLPLGCEVAHAGIAGVARPGGGEGLAHVEADHLDPGGAGMLDRAVGRAGIDINQGIGAPHQRGDALHQPLAFVAPDHHDADIAIRAHASFR